MKRFVLVAMIIGVAALGGQALLAKDGCPMKGGHYHGYGMASPEHLEYLQKHLGLSDAQVDKIFKIGTEFREKYHASRKNPDALKNLREQHRKAIESVLNEKQREEFKKFYKVKGGCPHAQA